MKIGVLELLLETAVLTRTDWAYGGRFKRSFVSITPQAVSAWCRQLGHETVYATYYGQDRPEHLLPDPLDVVFVSAYTLASPLAYALARLYRSKGAVTVIGGPHARSFPRDCLRFFDHVVIDCDKATIRDILAGAFERPSIVSSGKSLVDFPSLKERMPEVLAATFRRGRPSALSVVPLLSSVGCPYTCDFCVDWKNPYQLLPLDRLEADLRYLSEQLPGVLVVFHDPNFGVKFDQVLGVLEKIPRERRNPYAIESSLSILRGERLPRLKETRCVFVAPGVESWADYSNKAGVGRSVGRQKLEQVVEHFRELHEHVGGIQANFVFGVDGDEGDEPAELTKEFVRRLPFVWPTVNIPTPFGDTPLFERCLAEGRTLRAMPFAFYGVPYLVTALKHYRPAEYFSKLIDIYEAMTAWGLLKDRWAARLSFPLKALNTLRTLGIRQDLAEFRRIKRMLDTDRAFRAFHEGNAGPLPEYYHRRFEGRLGPYAELLSRADRRPEVEAPDERPQGAGAPLSASALGPGAAVVAPA